MPYQQQLQIARDRINQNRNPQQPNAGNSDMRYMPTQVNSTGPAGVNPMAQQQSQFLGGNQMQLAGQQTANPQAQQYYQQLLDAKRVDQTQGITDARRNQAHQQSNAARQSLLGMGIDLSTGAWAKGTSLDQSLADYNQMYNPDGINYDAAKPFYQQILDAMTVDQKSGNISAINQAHTLSNQARQELLKMGIDVSQGAWAKGTPYEQALAAFNEMYTQQQEDEFVQESNAIEDLAKKYGFDYSRDYAATQAEALAQAKRDAVAEGRKSVESGVMGAAEGLDRNYFNQYMMQAQDQTNRGLNAGISADQNLRLAMSRQAEMGDVYRDANLRNFELDNMSGRIEQERIAYEDQLFNERLQQGFQNVQTEKDFKLREGELTGSYVPEGVDKEKAFGLVEDLIGLKNKSASGELKTHYDYALNHAEANRIRSELAAMGVDMSLLGKDASVADIYNNMGNLFNTGQRRDNAAELKQSKEQWEAEIKQKDDHFNKQIELEFDKLDQEMKLFLKQLDWDKEKWNSLSAEQKEQFKISREQLAEQKRQFNSEQEWREYTYKNMSEYEKKTLDANISQFGDNMAWKMYEFDSTLDFQAGYYDNVGGEYGGF